MGAIQPTSYRIKNLDLSDIYSYGAYSILIPVSDDIQYNTVAVIKPFQLPVKRLINLLKMHF